MYKRDNRKVFHGPGCGRLGIPYSSKPEGKVELMEPARSMLFQGLQKIEF